MAGVGEVLVVVGRDREPRPRWHDRFFIAELPAACASTGSWASQGFHLRVGNPKVLGSNPTPATKKEPVRRGLRRGGPFDNPTVLISAQGSSRKSRPNATWEGPRAGPEGGSSYPLARRCPTSVRSERNGWRRGRELRLRPG
jgi:hypothetical protein